ncbi:hypothetical protein AAHC03_019223 [Spirometra sp. Aus1]
MPLSSSCDTTGGSTRCVLPISVSRPPTTHAHGSVALATAVADVRGRAEAEAARRRLVIAVKTATNQPARPLPL